MEGRTLKVQLRGYSLLASTGESVETAGPNGAW
jgi:hypothetical protein